MNILLPWEEYGMKIPLLYGRSIIDSQLYISNIHLQIPVGILLKGTKYEWVVFTEKYCDADAPAKHGIADSIEEAKIQADEAAIKCGYRFLNNNLTNLL